jgi:hypothetical protein
MSGILGARFLYGAAVHGVERTTLPQATKKNDEARALAAQTVRDDLRKACEAAKTPGHPMRHVVLAHFADRILALAEDHEKLAAALATTKTK